MCGGGSSAPPPPPPPPPPEAAPVMFGAKEQEQLNTNQRKKIGKAKLQVPLGGVSPLTGLGIPEP